MKSLALYLSSRLTTVNRVSIAGFMSEKFAARRHTISTASVWNTGTHSSAPKPSTVTIGTMASVAASPIHRVMRPVRKNCVNNVLPAEVKPPPSIGFECKTVVAWMPPFTPGRRGPDSVELCLAEPRKWRLQVALERA